MKKGFHLTIIAAVMVIAVVTSIRFFDADPSRKLSLQANNTKMDGSVIQVARDLSPSVVGIVSYGEKGDFFSRRTVQKSGSGVIIDNQGHIVTNNHVVEDSKRIVVVLADGKRKDVKLVGRDRRTDLALLRVAGVKVVPARLGNSDRLVVGESVVAIGNPLGLRFARSVTAGVISGLNRILTTEEGFVFKLIQTDAAINPGNSGGALANINGEVIGINTVKIAVTGFEGMGFAIPARQVKEVIAEIKSNGRVVRPVAGLKVLSEISEDDARYFNLPAKYGVAVNPDKEGPAYKAGLREYDIVRAVNNCSIKSTQDLQEAMFKCKAGDQVKIKVMRLPRGPEERVREFWYRVRLDGDGR